MKLIAASKALNSPLAANLRDEIKAMLSKVGQKRKSLASAVGTSDPNAKPLLKEIDMMIQNDANEKAITIKSLLKMAKSFAK